MKTSSNFVAIDGDQMVFACGFAAEGEPVSHALHLVKKKVEQILRDTGCENYGIFIKGEGNFRDEVSLDYKATRAARKPSSYEAIREYMIEHMGAETVNDMEADDMVSIVLFKDFLFHNGDPEETLVVVSSPDKDLNNTPGWHYNPMKRDLYWVSDLQAYRHFCYQLLMGDQVDNIKGLPSVPDHIREEYKLRSNKVGKATAKALLNTPRGLSDPFAFITQLYHEYGHSQGWGPITTDEYLLEQATLLWMLRDFNERFSLKHFGESYDRGRIWFGESLESSPVLKKE